MDTPFWLEKWQQGQIGFHQAKVNEYLLRHWQSMGVPDSATVFVPLCGKSLDMLWLREQGYQVIGVEVSEQACRAFFDENQIPYDETTDGSFQRFTTQGITIYCGDFFDLTAQHLQTVSVVYDRAALVAMPIDLRKAYVSHLRKVIPAGANIFLVTMEYDQTQMSGPPFAVLSPEVEACYTDAYDVNQVLKQDVLSNNQRFEERGVTSLSEAVYLIHSR